MLFVDELNISRTNYSVISVYMTLIQPDISACQCGRKQILSFHCGWMTTFQTYKKEPITGEIHHPG